MTATAEKELYTYQEEADTRMFLHESHASLHEHQTVTIVSTDTHVKEFICHHQSATPAALTLIGAARKRLCFISVSRLCEKLGPRVCLVLPSLHALTGCDALSSFAGKGMKRAFEMVRCESQFMSESVDVLGESLPLREQSITKLEEVVCRLYNGDQCKLVQFHQQVLPSDTTLSEPNYQAFLRKKALQLRIDQEPVKHGF